MSNLKLKLLSAGDVVKIMLNKYNVVLSPRTIKDYVKQGRAGQSLRKREPPPSLLPRETFNLLVESYQPYEQLAQVNG